MKITTIINEWINRIDNHIFKIPITNNTIINDTINYIPEYTLNFDGCSKGNPGHAGIGAVIYKNGQEIWHCSK